MIKTHRFSQPSLIENSLENHPQHSQQKMKTPYKPITPFLKERGRQRQPPSHPSVIIKSIFLFRIPIPYPLPFERCCHQTTLSASLKSGRRPVHRSFVWW
ncbi:hypothetical protein TNIN_236091 [Trichonephila inaurata madagascariensis]|uniref:Uncharacterized protein n=1 Tax=Trichonephila inaurata madagascariensis TaxID=2747483 RepID=A0A8X7CTF8_9ARAC|nr:hypothetical protein TNIN_236091 [Trichonephila inaurata madagascariensis]